MIYLVMIMIEKRTRHEDNRMFEIYQKLKVKCKCGHTQVIPVFKDYCYCSHCRNKLKNNTKLYFLYKLRKELENENK